MAPGGAGGPDEPRDFEDLRGTFPERLLGDAVDFLGLLNGFDGSSPDAKSSLPPNGPHAHPP